MRVAASQLPLPTTTPARRRRRASAPPTAAPRPPPRALAAILRSRVIACLRAQDSETALQAAHAAVHGGITVSVLGDFNIGMTAKLTSGRCAVVHFDSTAISSYLAQFFTLSPSHSHAEQRICPLSKINRAWDSRLGYRVIRCSCMLLRPSVIEDLCRSYPSLTFGVGTVLNAADARKAICAGAQFLMSPGTVLDILHDLKESNVLYIPGVLTTTEVLSACSAGAKVVKVYPVSVMGGEMYMSALKKPFPLVPMVASQGIKIGSIKGYMEAGASAVVLSDAIFDSQLMRDGKFNEISELANLATLEALKFTK
ncbi:hypothetical protein Zm00014a_038834 [Zea mays]|uniref:KHG/KDPG aldolase n=1 Tax=Zea mays TaxID=4577 RepID=A0A3L6E047_MAIZE|nr:KHG/KDPG aldolase [Zea mays]PWZ14271.1 hypothetical protein Zm00014a_038834 [Zea mays]